MAVKPGHPSLRHIEWLAKLMDSQFRIPGTNIRFGFDALLGLIPGAGDFGGFLISVVMLTTLARNGASGYVMARMFMNIIVDALVGSIPLLGDLFDVAFKANERNLQLMRDHYQEGKHQGSASRIIIPVILVLLLVLTAIGWMSYKLISWLIGLF